MNMLLTVWFVLRDKCRSIRSKLSFSDHADELLRLAEKREGIRWPSGSPRPEGANDARKRPSPRVNQQSSGEKVLMVGRRCGMTVSASQEEIEAFNAKRERAMGLPDHRSFGDGHGPKVYMHVEDGGIEMTDDQWNQFQNHVIDGKGLPPQVEEIMDRDRGDQGRA